jgi:hypothetical protein
MRQIRPIGRYVLVPRPAVGRQNGHARVRRFSLARVAVSPRGATGEDRHERLERVAGFGKAPPGSPQP